MHIKDELIFRISGENFQKLEEFRQTHMKTCRDKYPDSIGAMFTYEFIPTGLGCLATVKCPCGAEEDIGDNLLD